MKPFDCDACGHCCRHLPEIPASDMLGFRRPDGQCNHLTQDSKCDIYTTRPRSCRIDRHYKDEYKRSLTWAAYCRWTHSICDRLKELHGAKRE